MRIWNISLYNAYNSMNPAWVFRSHNDDGKSVIKNIPCSPAFHLLLTLTNSKLT